MSSTTTSKTFKKPLSATKRPRLRAQDVSVVYGTEPVLQDVSFEIQPGEFVGLVGQNGSGKTTLLRVLLGLMQPTRGQSERHGATIGYVPQRGQLYSGMVPISVIEVVKLGSKGDATKARRALQSVGMDTFEKRSFNELSGGQQQRVVIAKALASGANVLVLDEPTTGVDAASQAEFYNLLTRLHKEDRTIIMVSHDIDSVVKLATRVIFLDHSIMYDGSPAQFDLEQYVGSQHAVHIHARGHHA